MLRGQSITLLAVAWIEFAVTTILVFLRVMTYIFVTKEGAFWSHAFAIGAWVFGLCATLFIHFSTRNGMGMHATSLSDAQFANAMMCNWLADAMQRVSAAFGKLTVVAFLLEINKVMIKKWQYFFLVYMAASNVLTNFLVVFFIMFQCDPPAALWDKRISGPCPRRGANHNFGFFITAYSSVSDLALAIYPTSIVWKLQMRTRTKIGLTFLLGMGVLAAACAAMTCYQLHAVADTKDPTYNLTPLTLWGATEMWVVIIAASIPPLWPLFMRSKAKIKSLRSINSSIGKSRRSGSQLSKTTSSPDNVAARTTRPFYRLPKELEDNAEDIKRGGRGGQIELHPYPQSQYHAQTGRDPEYGFGPNTTYRSKIER